jgi:hypothetical protein
MSQINQKSASRTDDAIELWLKKIHLLRKIQNQVMQFFINKDVFHSKNNL